MKGSPGNSVHLARRAEELERMVKMGSPSHRKLRRWNNDRFIGTSSEHLHIRLENTEEGAEEENRLRLHLAVPFCFTGRLSAEAGAEDAWPWHSRRRLRLVRLLPRVGVRGWP